MGIIIKNYQNEIGFTSDKYIKIDSVRAGMGSNNKIDCCCTEWANTLARSNNNQYIKANVYYHIPDKDIVLKGGTLIEGVYPAFKKYFESLGYTVLDDTNTYGLNLEQKQHEAVNDGTE